MQLFFETADPFNMLLMILLLAFLFGFVGWIVYGVIKAGSENSSKTKKYKNDLKNLVPEYKQQYIKYCKRAKIELAKFINESFAEDELHSVVRFYADADVGYADRYIGQSKDKKELVCFDYINPVEHRCIYNTEVKPPKPHKIERIKRKPLDKILYFKYEENISYTTTVSGGGVNIKGAVAGALIAGAPGAIIGGRQQVESKTEKHQDTTFIIKYTDSPETKYEGKEAKQYYDAYMRVIPQKEYSYVSVESIKANENKKEKSNLDEIVKLKELLDMGAITQEEFDAKKKQILGL